MKDSYRIRIAKFFRSAARVFEDAASRKARHERHAQEVLKNQRSLLRILGSTCRHDLDIPQPYCDDCPLAWHDYCQRPKHFSK